MIESKPHWIQLLEYIHFKEKRTGLTIPFIIGAKLYFHKSELITIEDFLKDIINNSNQQSALYYCNQIKEYVLTVNPYIINGYSKNTLIFNKLKIIPLNGFLKGLTDLEHIIDCFDIFYQPQMTNSKYSVKDEIWCEFDNNDKVFIRTAYQFDYKR